MNKQNSNELLLNYGKDIFSFCIKLTNNKNEAEDLFQDIFLTAMEKDELDTIDNPKGYLLGIAANLWKNKKRKFAWRKRIAPVESIDDSYIEQAIDDDESTEYKIIKNEENIRLH